LCNNQKSNLALAIGAVKAHHPVRQALARGKKLARLKEIALPTNNLKSGVRSREATDARPPHQKMINEIGSNESLAGQSMCGFVEYG